MQRIAYTPVQLAAVLAWKPAQLDAGRRARLIPAPDVTRPQRLGPRWSPTLTRRIVACRDDLTAHLAMGSLGAYQTAQAMTEKLGVDVDSAAVAELARAGHIPVTGDFRGNALYAVWAACAIIDLPLLAQAAVDGELRTTDGAAQWMSIRRADVDQLVRRDWLTPARMADNPHLSRSAGAGTMALYRTADLAALLAYPGIDWTAVRATARGRRAPLPGAPPRPDQRAEFAQISAGITGHQLGHRRWAAGDRTAAITSWRTATRHRDTAEHLADAEAGSDVSVRRCAAWMALLPADRAALV
jgi:hypothetical protein